MVRFCALLFAIFPSFCLLSLSSAEEVLNYAEWKAQRVYEAEIALNQAQNVARPLGAVRHQRRSVAVPAVEPDEKAEGTGLKEGASRRMRIQTQASSTDLVGEAQRSLAAAKELNAADYYLLYLKNRPPEVIRRMCEKLSKAELIEILAASASPDRTVGL